MLRIRPPSPTSESDLRIRPPSPTSDSDLRIRPPSPTSESDLRVRPPNPTSESDLRVRPPSPTSASDLRVRPPRPTSASDLRVRPPSPTSESDLRLRPPSPTSDRDLRAGGAVGRVVLACLPLRERSVPAPLGFLRLCFGCAVTLLSLGRACKPERHDPPLTLLSSMSPLRPLPSFGLWWPRCDGSTEISATNFAALSPPLLSTSPKATEAPAAIASRDSPRRWAPPGRLAQLSA